MMTIIGSVEEVHGGTKSFSVSAVVRGRGGREVEKTFKVFWSDNTTFFSKGRRRTPSQANKIRPGTRRVLTARTTSSGSLVATEVWHPTTGGVLALTASECKNLGGTVSDDQDCPMTKKRCTTVGGSMCI